MTRPETTAVVLVLAVTGCGNAASARPTAYFDLVVLNGVDEPVEGANVAARGPDGVVEARTDATGRVVLPMDLAKVESVIAHKPGWTFAAGGGDWLRRSSGSADEMPALVLFERTPPSTVILSGEATGMTDEANALGVSALTPNSLHVDLGPSWSLEVAADEPTTLFAVEAQFNPLVERTVDRRFIAFAASESLTPEEGQSVAIDFEQGILDVVTVSGSLPMPEDALLAKSCAAYPNVWGGSSGELVAYLGGGELIAPTASGDRFDFDGRYAVPDGVDLFTQIQCESASGFTRIVSAGPLSDGPLDVSWPSPPRLASELGTAPHPLSEPLVWTIDGGAPPDVVVVQLNDGDGLVGTMRVAPERTEASVPALPPSSDPLELFDLDVRGTVFACQTGPDDACWGLAAAPSFFVAP